MVRIPPLNWLKAFEAAARHSSVSAGARALNVTTSAVSQQVKRLEETLGVPLLHRDGNRVRPSDHGRLLAVRLREAFDLIEEAVEPFAPRASGELIVQAPAELLRCWLAPRLAAVALAGGPRARVASAGAEQTADVEVICAARAPSPNAERLLDVTLTAVCAPCYRDSLKPGESVTLIAGPEDDGRWDALLEQSDGPRWRDPIVVPAFGRTVALQAARIGLGLALASERCVAADLEIGWLVKPFAARLVTEDAYWAQIRRPSAAAARLMAALTCDAPPQSFEAGPSALACYAT
jgi:DNA-binding transcriptional LysR family regulator